MKKNKIQLACLCAVSRAKGKTACAECMRVYKKEFAVPLFLRESNLIEREPSDVAFSDAIDAWEYLNGYKDLTIGGILETHRLLMRRLNPRIAGKLRMVEVRVGSRICPDPKKVKGLLLDWFYAQNINPPTTSAAIKKAHVAFENIHPFEDGNGRTGRILMNWQRIKAGLPILIIHADWPKKGGEQRAYYSWFD